MLAPSDLLPVKYPPRGVGCGRLAVPPIGCPRAGRARPPCGRPARRRRCRTGRGRPPRRSGDLPAARPRPARVQRRRRRNRRCGGRPRRRRAQGRPRLRRQRQRRRRRRWRPMPFDLLMEQQAASSTSSTSARRAILAFGSSRASYTPSPARCVYGHAMVLTPGRHMMGVCMVLGGAERMPLHVTTGTSPGNKSVPVFRAPMQPRPLHPSPPNGCISPT